MFKLFATLARGQIHDAAEAALDQQAIPLLRQQIRDCAQEVDLSRRAVAVAMAQNEREIEQHAAICKQIADLETRTLAALDAGKDALAHEAAEAIAHLEAERDVSATAQERFQTEITRLRTVLRNSESRLRQLQRGQRLAAATDKTQKLRTRLPQAGRPVLSEAEATLARVQARQAESEAAARAMEKLDAEGCAEALQTRLSEAGCGPKLKTKAEDVIARLKQKTETDV